MLEVHYTVGREVPLAEKYVALESVDILTKVSEPAEMLFFSETNDLSQAVMIQIVSLGCPRPLSQNHSDYFLLVFILFLHYFLPPNLHVVVISVYNSFAIITVLLF